MVDRRIPSSSAPVTRRAISTAIVNSPKIARSVGGDFNAPSVTSVPGDATTMPLHSRPMSAMSNPMPTAMACFSESGMATMSRSRRPMLAVRMKISPAMATPPSATRHGTCIVTATVNAKKKLCPIAGATAIG